MVALEGLNRQPHTNAFRRKGWLRRYLGQPFCLAQTRSGGGHLRIVADGLLAAGGRCGGFTQGPRGPPRASLLISGRPRRGRKSR